MTTNTTFLQSQAPQSVPQQPHITQQPQTAPILHAHDLVMDYSAQRNAERAQNATVPLNTATQHTIALNHVNFALAPNESVAVMGPSGSGKSTLLHVLAGIIAPTYGTVQFRGTNLATMTDADRTQLRRNAFGFVFQSGQLLPELPAVENIALPLMLNGTPYHQAIDQAVLWLERLNLRHVINSRPGEMSGGQMQRVAIARALCVNPSIIFADEPTGALDQTTGREVIQLLMDAARANQAAVVLVTHDPNVAAHCSRTVHMQDGMILAPPARA